MLTKLLKYEMKASARTLLPLYLGMIVIAIIGGVQLKWNINRLYGNASGEYIDPFFNINISVVGIGGLVLIALTVAVLVLTALIIVQRFHNNLLDNEGYLMMTLPVTRNQLILSKLAGAFLWCCLSVLVIAGAWFFLLSPMLTVKEILNQLTYLWSYWVVNRFVAASGATKFAVIGQMIQLPLGIISTILCAYLSMMIGQMEQFHKYHTAISVVAFVVIGWIMGVFFASISVCVFHFVPPDISSETLILLSTAFTLVEEIIQIMVLFLATGWMMNHKLNL